MSDSKISAESAQSLIKGVVGQYIWNVRCLQDRILQAEFGEPHLRIDDLPMMQGSKLNGFARRNVSPAGRWTLFVEDGLWSIVTADHRCDRETSDDEAIKACLNALAGQKVTRIAMADGDANLKIDFDLSGSLSIGLSVEFESNDQWMLFAKDDGILAYNHQNGFELERSN